MGQWQRVHFFDELSRHDVIIETFNPLTCKSWDEANYKAQMIIRNGGFDLFLTCLCSKDVLHVDTMNAVREKGIPSLCIRYDNLVIPFNDKELAPHFDLLWLTSIETKRLYDKWGVNTVFAPYAANPYTFQYVETPLIRKVCFIGNPYGSRSRMINSLTNSGVDLDLYHGGITLDDSQAPMKNSIHPIIQIPSADKMKTFINRMRFREGRRLIKGTLVNRLKGNIDIKRNDHLFMHPSVKLKKICYTYSEHALSLASTSAVHTDVLKEPLKIINLRNFEIPMSGGVELCRYNPELASYFEEGKEIIFYKNNEELVEKAKYYTTSASDDEIYSIMRAARKRAENEHTWYHRFSKVLGILGFKLQSL
jgi:Uncharacterized protein conserved in bacteria